MVKKTGEATVEGKGERKVAENYSQEGSIRSMHEDIGDIEAQVIMVHERKNTLYNDDMHFVKRTKQLNEFGE